MKKMKVFFFLFFALNFGFAQTENLPKQTVDGKTVFVYKIVAGDGWYSIARKFKVTYAELKLANKKTDKLKVGEKIFIPSKLKSNDPYFEKNHVDDSRDKVKTTSDKKIVHQVKSSETLFAIAKKYNVSVNQIKQLNRLNSTSIRKGQKLIISESNSGNETVVEKPEEKVIRKEEANVPADKLPKAEKIESEKVVSIPVAHESAEPKEVKGKAEHGIDDKKIVFANGRQEINETGVASWIEDETSGKNKYYALHRTAPAGTIIKITNRMNSRSIYVKVVGLLPDTGDNEGLIIKVSKSGAEKLGVIDSRFQASLLYGISSK